MDLAWIQANWIVVASAGAGVLLLLVVVLGVLSKGKSELKGGCQPYVKPMPAPPQRRPPLIPPLGLGLSGPRPPFWTGRSRAAIL